MTVQERLCILIMLMADLDNEILEMAAAREVDANRFFLALAERVKDPRTKKVFRMLAEEELEHKSLIELEIMKTGRVVKKNLNPPGFSDEKPDYAPLKVEMSYKDILQMGLQKEEASIKLYTELAAMTSDAHSREVLLNLAQEEAIHKQRFQKALDFLKHIA